VSCRRRDERCADHDEGGSLAIATGGWCGGHSLTLAPSARRVLAAAAILTTMYTPGLAQTLYRASASSRIMVRMAEVVPTEGLPRCCPLPVELRPSVAGTTQESAGR
jgi:hypothetical protein